jgi:xanthine/CO dehydrogenase XdhC/CoxF family maturation factor
MTMGIATLTGFRRRGFFIPYRYAERQPPLPAHGAYPAMARLLAAAEPAMAEVIAAIAACAEDLRAIPVEGGPPEPRWNQDWFPGLDAAAAYAMVRSRRPGRIVELGSGHSTRFLVRAVRDGALGATVTAIDPAPRAALLGLGVTHHRATLQELAGSDAAPLADLSPGDVLFVDSSHVLMPGSDVDLLVAEILPALPRGVLVHVHDIFLPDDYPADWRWRGYNEQSAVAALIAGGAYEPLFASHYLRAHAPHLLAALPETAYSAPPGSHESSLWLLKTGSRPITGK